MEDEISDGYRSKGREKPTPNPVLIREVSRSTN